MKTCKRTLAFILCLCMLLSVMVFSASAEDAAQPVGITITEGKAVKLKEGDPETVLQLELTVTAKTDERDLPLATFDKVNTDAEITIYEGLYVGIYEMMAEVLTVSENDVLKTGTIAKAKPVSYADGKLTLDVFSTNGEAGAKMISIQLHGMLESDLGGFIFDIPEGLLSESNSGKKSAAGALGASIAGLSVKELKPPALVTGILNDMEDGNMGGLIGKAALVLPFAFIILPIVLMTIASRANKIYKIYGINVYKIVGDAWRALHKIIPYLISELL